MWWYNTVRRHIDTAIVAILWYRDRGTFVGRPRSGKITPTTLAWADEVIAQVKD